MMMMMINAICGDLLIEGNQREKLRSGRERERVQAVKMDTLEEILGNPSNYLRSRIVVEWLRAI